MSENNILVVENLVKTFPYKGKNVLKAVDQVNFHIQKGETFGLVGESGCGKSTVARTIMRIYDPTAGNIYLDGEEIGHKTQPQLKPFRKRMQMIFQDPYSSLNGRMTISEILSEPLIANGIAPTSAEGKALLNYAISKVGLNSSHMSRYPHEFSGGQRQRIGIARALIVKPEIIICDEPISALDVSIQAQIINMLSDFQKELGLSYLFIAHDLSMVRYFSHRVGVMYLGKMVELCSSEEIYDRPLHPYTKALLSSVPIADPVAIKTKVRIPLEGEVPSPIHPPSGCHFHKRCKEVMPQCKTQYPPYIEVQPGHFVACHLYTC